MAPTKPTKPTEKPGKTTAGVQKSQRPSKRFLVRWNEDMDKKLLLTVQWACNKKGVKIPWDIVGKEMGETITESAVIQHLAKLRQRMVKDDLPVPPALTRGGRNEKKSAVQNPTANRVSKRVSKKKEASRRADQQEEDSDSDGEYNSEEETTPKKTAKKGKKPAAKTRVKKEDSSPEHIFSRNATDHDSEQEMAEQSYAVGDGMWDLEAKDMSNPKGKQNASKSSGQSSGKELGSKANHGASESPGASSNPASKSDATRMRSESSRQSGRSSRYASMSDTHRMPSESSGQSPKQNSQVVKLRIGKEGFAKLQLSEQTYNTHPAEGSNHPSENAYSSSDAEDDENEIAMMQDGSGDLDAYGEEDGAGFGGLEHLASESGADYLAAQHHLPASASEADYLAAPHHLLPYHHELDVSQQHMAAYGSFPSSHEEAAAELRSINFGTPHPQYNFGYGTNASHGYENRFAGQAVSGMTHDATYGGMNGPTYTDGGVFSGQSVFPGLQNQLPMGAVLFNHDMGFFESAYNGDASHYHANEFATLASLDQHASGQGERSLGSPFQDPPCLSTFGQDQKPFKSDDLH
ncbi:MAG: hypothetical protein Q9208_005446 [Pyrenodesmia sp. 3 TL-2023]